MSDDERLVAVISPWTKLSELVKKKFRVESLPAERMVMVWRDDLQTEAALRKELEALGVAPSEIRVSKVTSRWQDVR